MKLTERELQKQYDEMLDERYSFKSVGGPFSDMQPSEVLRKIDPIWYQEELNDYLDSLDR